jgi:hypothetical protein
VNASEFVDSRNKWQLNFPRAIEQFSIKELKDDEWIFEKMVHEFRPSFPDGSASLPVSMSKLVSQNPFDDDASAALPVSMSKLVSQNPFDDECDTELD